MKVASFQGWLLEVNAPQIGERLAWVSDPSRYIRGFGRAYGELEAVEAAFKDAMRQGEMWEIVHLESSYHLHLEREARNYEMACEAIRLRGHDLAAMLNHEE